MDRYAQLSDIKKLEARVKALESAQNLQQQDESHRFCTDAIVRRVEALEADQWLRQHAKPNPARRPLDIETTYGSEAAADAAQILHAPMVVEGTFDHGGKTYRYKANATPERDPAMPEPRAASAEARPAGGLVERVAALIEFGIDANLDPEGIARAVICEQAAWLRELHPSPGMASAALRLEQEANE